jgi:carbamoyltransferase
LKDSILAVGFRAGGFREEIGSIFNHLKALDIGKANRCFNALNEYYLTLDNVFQELGQWSEVKFFDHHQCHAMSVVAMNNYQPGLVLSVDGWGGASSGLVARWDGDSLQNLYAIPNEFSIGVFFEEFTDFCGLRRHQNEGSLMGMAALAKGNSVVIPAQFFSGDHGLCEWIKIREWLATLDKPDTDEMRARYALAAQSGLEEMMANLVAAFIKPGDTNILLAGGVAMNCSSNGKLTQRFPQQRIVVQPASTDSGTAFGAAVLASLQRGQRVSFNTPYLGREITDTTYDFTASYVKQVPFEPGQLAEMLVQGKVIAFCQGRDEVGPRALCNRSIIASPFVKANKDKLNRIKRRQWWRPLAPVTCSSLLPLVVGSIPNADLRFMNVACDASSTLQDKGAACIHLDNTIRPQVLEALHPLNAVVLQHEQITGCPALINTSFNVGNEPMVSSFEDALRTFFISPEIDVLVVQDKMYIK